MIAKSLNLFIFMDDRSHVLNLLTVEKLRNETGNVQPIFNKMNKFGNLVLSHSLIADGSWSKGLADHKRFHNIIS